MNGVRRHAVIVIVPGLKYSDIIGPILSLQFFNVYHLVPPKLTEACTVLQLCRDIIAKFGVFECDVTVVYIAMLLYHAVYVTSVS